MRRKLLAFGLAMMMVMAFSGVAVANDHAPCNVEFIVLDMEGEPYDNVTVDLHDAGQWETGPESNTVAVELQQHHHYNVNVQDHPYLGSTKFYTGDEETMNVTIYMLYDDGNTGKVFFEVTEEIGVTLHAHWDHVSIRTGQTEFAPVQFEAQIHHGGHEEIYEGVVTAFTKTDDGGWTVVAENPGPADMAFQFSADDMAYVGVDLLAGHTLPATFNETNHFQQEFWLKGLTSANTLANTMGNVYFRLEVALPQ